MILTEQCLTGPVAIGQAQADRGKPLSLRVPTAPMVLHQGQVLPGVNSCHPLWLPSNLMPGVKPSGKGKAWHELTPGSTYLPANHCRPSMRSVLIVWITLPPFALYR